MSVCRFHISYTCSLGEPYHLSPIVGHQLVSGPAQMNPRAEPASSLPSGLKTNARSGGKKGGEVNLKSSLVIFLCVLRME